MYNEINTKVTILYVYSISNKNITYQKNSDNRTFLFINLNTLFTKKKKKL